MSFDNLFETMGPLGTSMALCAILAMVGTPAVVSIVCRGGVLRRFQRSL